MGPAARKWPGTAFSLLLEESSMIEALVAVLLRLAMLLVAFGILTAVFLLRMLIRKGYAAVTQLSVRHSRADRDIGSLQSVEESRQGL